MAAAGVATVGAAERGLASDPALVLSHSRLKKCNSIMWTHEQMKTLRTEKLEKKTLRGYNGCLKMQSYNEKKGAAVEKSFVLFVSLKKWGWSSPLQKKEDCWIVFI